MWKSVGKSSCGLIKHFLTINKYITFTSQKIAGNSDTKIAKGCRIRRKIRRRMEVWELSV